MISAARVIFWANNHQKTEPVFKQDSYSHVYHHKRLPYFRKEDTWSVFFFFESLKRMSLERNAHVVPFPAKFMKTDIPNV